MRTKLPLLVILCLLLAPVLAGRISPSLAAEFTINSTADVNDLEPGNGLCVAYLLVFPPFVLPYCTLRAAIEETNQLPGPDTINIPAVTTLLELSGINEDNSLTGDFDITDILIIRGSGVDQTIVDGSALDRTFDIPNPNTTVRIENLTITGGSLPSSLPALHKGGGGIRNRGNLTLHNVSIRNNRLHGSATGDYGGGILNLSDCSVTASTVSANQATLGGGIHNGHGGNLTVGSSTIHSNIAVLGGGMANEGTTRISNTTVSGNTSGNSGGGIYNYSDMEILQSTIVTNSSLGTGNNLSNQGTIALANTIIDKSAGNNCFQSGFVNSLGSNIDAENSCGLDPAIDFINTDPRLDSLQYNGGPTLTHGLYIGSPAVDRGLDLSSIGIITDQRGVKRPDGTAYDIGAFETRKRSISPLISPLLFQNN